jgi:hypothetical protein
MRCKSGLDSTDRVPRRRTAASWETRHHGRPDAAAARFSASRTVRRSQPASRSHLLLALIGACVRVGPFASTWAGILLFLALIFARAAWTYRHTRRVLRTQEATDPLTNAYAVTGGVETGDSVLRRRVAGKRVVPSGGTRTSSCASCVVRAPKSRRASFMNTGRYEVARLSIRSKTGLSRCVQIVLAAVSY